jgi:hypothetical protein
MKYVHWTKYPMPYWIMPVSRISKDFRSFTNMVK